MCAAHRVHEALPVAAGIRRDEVHCIPVSRQLLDDLQHVSQVVEAASGVESGTWSVEVVGRDAEGKVLQTSTVERLDRSRGG